MPKTLLVSVALLASASSALADQPIDVVHRLVDAIRNGDKAAIGPFYATLNGKAADLAWIDTVLQSDDNDFVSPTWCFESKTINDAAVVIVGSLKRRNLDLDPCYMIRVGDQWRILPEHTDIKVAWGAVPESTMEALQQLTDWYSSRTNTLFEEIGRELEASWKKKTPPTPAETHKLMVDAFSKRDPKGHPTARKSAETLKR
jgi:hypothetical protein